MDFMKEGREKLRCFRYFDVLWATKERTDSRIVETIHMSRGHDF
jgi:hypothetical protein